MKVLLTSVGPERGEPGATGIDRCAYRKLLECAGIDRFGEHQLTSDPDDADLILFAELGYSSAVGLFDSRIRRHPYVAEHRSKVFVMNSADVAVPYFPGLYPSIERSTYDARRVRSCHYVSTHIAVPPLVERDPEERDLLFSFMGTAANHPVRQRLMGLDHPRAILRDVAGGVWGTGRENVRRFLHEYAETMARSRFALCPRGLGTSSLRLFESMRFGIAPVILSDAWVPPTGPAWDAFSVRVPEREVARIPDLLGGLEERSVEMGRLARRAWEDWFADDVTFHRVVGWCAEILEARGTGGDPLVGRFKAYAQTLRPVHLRVAARHIARRLAGRTRSAPVQERVKAAQGKRDAA